MNIGPGRIINHDPRSRNYAYPRTAPTRGLSVRHLFSATNLDQFYTSGCVGFSGSNMLNCAKATRSRRAYNRFFANRARMQWPVHQYCDNQAGLDNYSGSTEYDPFPWRYPPTDEGSSALGLMKYWKKYSIITGYAWAFTFDQFCAALQRQPVLVGTNWYERMSEPHTDGVAYPFGDLVGGHEYLAIGIRYDRRWIRFENSWGEQWGNRGGFYMHFDYVRNLLDANGDVAIPAFL